jgi:hypothetical protein
MQSTTDLKNAFDRLSVAIKIKPFPLGKVKIILGEISDARSAVNNPITTLQPCYLVEVENTRIENTLSTSDDEIDDDSLYL